MTNLIQTSKLGFETEICGRCGGSGLYSYNETNGSTCFGCGGKKTKHTKRGAVAYQRYCDSLKVEMGSLVVGDLMEVKVVGLGGSTTAFERVTEIRPDRHEGSIMVVTTSKNGRSLGNVSSPDAMVRKGWDEATKQAKLAEALAFQATLTQAGKPAKGKVK